MYNKLTLEQLKLSLEHTKKDIIITKICRNIVAGEFHDLIGIEIYKLIYEYFIRNPKTLPREIQFWFNDNIDIAIIALIGLLGITWVCYQNSLNDLFEIHDELYLEQKQRTKFIKQI